MEPQIFQRMLDQLKTDLRADLRADLQEQLDRRFAESGRSLQEQVEHALTENRRHFDVVAEGLRSNVQLIAEGLATSNERNERLHRELRAEMQDGFSDLRSMIRLSYVELEGRLRSLENSLMILQSRVDRLEEAAS